jgi:hypothetical protein
MISEKTVQNASMRHTEIENGGWLMAPTCSRRWAGLLRQHCCRSPF